MRDWAARELFIGERPSEPEIEREVVPLEGTNMSLFHSIIPSWWSENVTPGAWWPTPTLADRVWVADRCVKLNAQQIAAMPLEFSGTEEPAWISNPDPSWFPNGIGDALHITVEQIYKWGFSCCYITDRYADGFARRWTVLDSANVNIRLEDGVRQYKYGEDPLDRSRVVQIDRNPGLRLHGTPALSAYAQVAWSLLAAGNQSLDVSSGGIPNFYLQMTRKITADQAIAVQTQWVERTGQRNGGPPVVPPEIEPKAMSFDPSDMALLETQEWNARVIATAYGVPSVILNMALQGGLTYQNPLALMQMWWLTELRTTAKRIADAFTAQMLPAGQWVSFDASDITVEGAISAEDDPQLSQVAKASPAQQPVAPVRPLSAIGGQP